ncbi:unnamed protein product [Cladocopium goreaui]|uniref:Uncharacterized protein n=1 Tax=Cladocopium goreaui TaxID=2562237 RepID=A0A9P1G7N8_9DINO|nr:unnamed protein product [Cladocopium goreaui]|mmetsp:Transcript_1710/g.3593  ORF Transcript_1710/g.3593 Transcript_1710/m.3593 type:complete len:910 (-) Transcript_1710:19-2748(-)
MVLGGFDLLRSWRKSPEMDEAGATTGATAEPEMPEGLEPMVRPSTPVGSISTDARVGLWWYIHDSKILLFQLPGPHWPPCGALQLPEFSTLSANCVAPLTTVVQQGSNTLRHPTVAAVYDDFQLSVFPHGRRVDLKPLGANWPSGEVPILVRTAAPHPSAVGVVLLVVTQSGRLLSIFLSQTSGSFEAEASRLWPMVSEHCLKNFFKRIRRYGFGDVSQDRQSLEDAQFLAHHIEILPAPRRGTLFEVLAWGEEHLALYSHPRSVASADLMWVCSLAQLVTGDVMPGRLLSACCCWDCEASRTESLLLLFSCEDPSTRRQSAMLTRLALPSRAASPLEPSTAVAVGPNPVLPRGLMTACGDTAVTAVQVDNERFCICMVNMPPRPAGLEAGVQQIVEFGIVGLSLLPEGVSVGHIQVLTPHGLLSCPQDMFGGDKELKQGKNPSTADAFVQVASEFFDAGQEDQASSLCGRAFSQLGAQAMLGAVERRTQHLLDSGGESSLSEKAKALEDWLRFLHKAGVWIRMGNAPNITAAQQKVVEACERVAALQQMREYHDLEPDVFASSIHHALDGQGSGKSDEEIQEFYSRPSECERLLPSLAQYPRTLPFGSGGAWDAVVFVHGVVCGFLDAALERRGHVLKTHPTSLPPPESHQLQRYWPKSVEPVTGVGSGWLMSSSIQRALEDIRTLSLDVLPVPKQRLPLLDAQALRVIEGLQQLCRSSLRAAHASFVDLHANPMAKFREAVLKDMAYAEASLHENAKILKHRTLALSEEFEDVEVFVRLSALIDLPRLDSMMLRSEAFRRRVFEQCLAEEQLHPLFFRMVRCFPPTKSLLEELLQPYPELRWTLELNALTEVFNTGQWPAALHTVKEIAIKAMERADTTKDQNRAKSLKALAAIATAAQDRVLRCPS